jgi:hypothetical protein
VKGVLQRITTPDTFVYTPVIVTSTERELQCLEQHHENRQHLYYSLPTINCEHACRVVPHPMREATAATTQKPIV